MNYNKLLDEFKLTLNELKKLHNSTKQSIQENQKKNQEILKEIADFKSKRKPNIPKEKLIESKLLLKNSYMPDKDFNENMNNYKSIMESRQIKESLLIDENFDDINKINPNNFQVSDLIRLNLVEKVYINENFEQEIETSYILMAVGLGSNRFFTNTTQTFDLNSKIEMIECKVNNQPVYNNFYNNTLTLNFHLYNGETCPIYYKYKRKDLDRNNKSKVAQKLWIGIWDSNAGYKAKYILNLHDKIKVVNFEKEFLKKTNDNSYYYFGVVPQEGLRTVAYFSKKKAKWNLIYRTKAKNNSGYCVDNMELKCPVYYKGGNNEIINLKICSSQANNVDNNYIKEQNNDYIVRYERLNTSKVFFDQQALLYNYCNKVWECNKKVIIPDDQKKNKKTFVDLVKKIQNQNKENIPLYRKFIFLC